MAREDMAFQRDEANTQREWEEDLERRKALSSTKEEEARIRALREEQEAAVESGQETAMAMGDMQDTDTANSNMWSSLASGSDGAWGSLYGDD
jgi:5'-3' exonuclease